MLLKCVGGTVKLVTAVYITVVYWDTFSIILFLMLGCTGLEKQFKYQIIKQ